MPTGKLIRREGFTGLQEKQRTEIKMFRQIVQGPHPGREGVTGFISQRLILL